MQIMILQYYFGYYWKTYKILIFTLDLISPKKKKEEDGAHHVNIMLHLVH